VTGAPESQLTLIGFAGKTATFGVLFRDGKAVAWPPIAATRLRECAFAQGGFVRLMRSQGSQVKVIWHDP
jgi:hypothetical protein